MARELPAIGSKNWGVPLNAVISEVFVAADAVEAAVPLAEAARDDAEAARDAAQAVGTTSDAVIAGVLANPASATAVSLSGTYVTLAAAAKNPDLLVAGAVTGDPLTSAEVVWPDGTPGLLTITARHATGAVNSYKITYGNPVTKTFTQPAITRATSGAATNVPQIVVS